MAASAHTDARLAALVHVSISSTSSNRAELLERTRASATGRPNPVSLSNLA
jgi:hypothetical protein